MLNSQNIKRLISLALDEDHVQSDVTTDALKLGPIAGIGALIAKQPLVACGLPLVAEICSQAACAVKITDLAHEGQRLESGASLGKISGSFSDLLRIERTVLNILQRISGVATHTSRLVQLASPIVLLDTRKTIPGWRALDKYAVSIGAGKNHRHSLADMLLVKNNHVDAVGGMREALTRIQANRPAGLELEVEVRDLAELDIALEFKPDWIMLDNFSNSLLSEALQKLNGADVKVEVSGGVTEARFEELKQLGVGYASLGALTHSAPNVDISFRITPL